MKNRKFSTAGSLTNCTMTHTFFYHYGTIYVFAKHIEINDEIYTDNKSKDQSTSVGKD